MSTISIDFTKVIGKIKPVNGVGQPPFIGMDFSMCDYLKDANIPYSRLHDVGGAFGRNLFVDIPNIFRDFDADPKNPESYDFAFTDKLISALSDRGIEPFFRLGVTIENYSSIKAYRIYPPKDYTKWAEICEGIIRHYTEGWADGFYYDIKYWEIWNEPDNFEEIDRNHMWKGSAEEFYRLYEIASKHLKLKFPHLKIGGYSSCGFYAITNAKNVNAGCSPRIRCFLDFFDGFMDYIKAHDCPLDFFSWHSYSNIENNVIWSEYVRNRLDEAGYKNTEHTLNEWNCEPESKGSIRHAALTCGMMLALQNTSLDSAMFYDARCGIGMYSGMFNCMTYKPLPSYYSFVAFGELYKRENQVYVSEMPNGVYGIAAIEDDGCLVLSNVNSNDVNIELDTKGAEQIVECKIIKEGAVWEDFAFENLIPTESVLCIKFTL